MLFDFCMAEAHAKMALAEQGDHAKARAHAASADHPERAVRDDQFANSVAISKGLPVVCASCLGDRAVGWQEIPGDVGVCRVCGDCMDGARSPVPDSEHGGEC